MASLLSLLLQSQKLSLFLNVSFFFLLSFYITTYSFHSNNNITVENHYPFIRNQIVSNNSCTDLHNLKDYESKCSFVKSEVACKSQGYIDYLQILYCTCAGVPVLGHIVLILWLVILFYLLSDTAAHYFCPSLENLSRILKLSPKIAGVTLLSLGNGAPDVFTSIVSFTRSNNGDFGLNSILGGALFVSSFVVGTICVLIGNKEASVDKASFIRDVSFFIISLGALFLIVFIGKITFWVALSYVSIYFLYVAFLSAPHFFSSKKPEPSLILSSNEELAKTGNIPLLEYIDSSITTRDLENQEEQEPKIFNLDSSSRYYYCLSIFLLVLQSPLYLPRRLTIPVVNSQRWSKPYAVASVTLAPLLIAEVCSFQNIGSQRDAVPYIISGLIGLTFGSFAIFFTRGSHPPKKFLLPWLVGGFTMSMTWSYIIAQELVSLLVALGTVLGISPSVLGLTVLAWGNSLGDLIANVTMATTGGLDGAQIALSGCYAGPMFNTMIGLGMPLVMSSLAEYPGAYVISRDNSLYETLGFLMGGLLWVLVILPRRNMRLDRLVGGGLLAIYFCFLFLRLIRAFGLLNSSY